MLAASEGAALGSAYPGRVSEEPGSVGPAGPQWPAVTSPVPVLAPGRSLLVEAYVGRKAGGWPFARFDVGPAGLRVRVRLPWFACPVGSTGGGNGRVGWPPTWP